MKKVNKNISKKFLVFGVFASILLLYGTHSFPMKKFLGTFFPEEKYPLHKACEKNNTKKFKVLAQKYLKSNVYAYKIKEFDQIGITPLHIACAMGNLEIVRYILEKNPELAQTKTKKYEYTPLHCACISGKMDIIMYLIGTHKVKINVSSIPEDTFHKKIFKTCEVMINFHNERGKTPMELAKKAKQKEVVKFLEQVIKSKKKRLMEICKTGSLKDFKKITQELALEHMSSQYLELAYKNKKLNLFSYILQFPINIKCTKYKIFCLACKNNQTKFIKRIEKKALNSELLLPYACSHGYIEACKYFFKKFEHNINKTYGSSKETPLYTACSNAQLETVKYFIMEHGADVTIANRYKMAPIETIFLSMEKKFKKKKYTNEDFKIAKILLENGATMKQEYINEISHKKTRKILQTAHDYHNCKTRQEKINLIINTSNDKQVQQLLIRIAFGDLQKLFKKIAPVEADIFLQIYKNKKIDIRSALHVNRKEDILEFIKLVLVKKENIFPKKLRLLPKILSFRFKQNLRNNKLYDITISCQN
ncbi:ankyrin repeat domain-containing protein [Candidatus Dependentiae bacterium]